MVPPMPDATKATLILVVYTLSQHGVYTKRMITFEGDFDRDVELPLCVYETPDGGFKFTTEDIHLSVDIPEPPEPDDVPRAVTATARSTATLGLSGIDLPARPPTLPENPTAEERWKYLLEVLKQAAD